PTSRGVPGTGRLQGAGPTQCPSTSVAVVHLAAAVCVLTPLLSDRRQPVSLRATVSILFRQPGELPFVQILGRLPGKIILHPRAIESDPCYVAQPKSAPGQKGCFRQDVGGFGAPQAAPPYEHRLQGARIPAN